MLVEVKYFCHAFISMDKTRLMENLPLSHKSIGQPAWKPYGHHRLLSSTIMEVLETHACQLSDIFTIRNEQGVFKIETAQEVVDNAKRQVSYTLSPKKKITKLYFDKGEFLRKVGAGARVPDKIQK